MALAGATSHCYPFYMSFYSAYPHPPPPMPAERSIPVLSLLWLTALLAACPPVRRDPQETKPPQDTEPSVDSGQDTADSIPILGCRIHLTLDEERALLSWSVEASSAVTGVQLDARWYDDMVIRHVEASSAEGNMGLLPHALDGHTLQDSFGRVFELHATASLSDGGHCDVERSFPFLEIEYDVADYLPPTFEFLEEAISPEFEQAIEDAVFIRIVAMEPGENGYTHYVVVHDFFGTPLRIYPISKEMVDTVTAEPLGFAILTGADAHDGKLYAMIDSFPNFQVGAILILDALSGELTSFIQTPEDTLLNHRLSVRQGEGTSTIMDTLAWEFTQDSDANQAVEVRLSVEASQASIDSVSAWFDPLTELQLTGRLYCNSTAPSPEWQVVTCPNNYGGGTGYPETELIVAMRPDTEERMAFLREGFRDSLLEEGWEHRFGAVVQLPDHPVYGEPLLSMVHDAVIQEDRIAILSLQIDSTTEHHSSVYMLDFDALRGTATFRCGYEHECMIPNYGNLLQPEGSPLIGLHLPNSGGIRWLDESCQLIGAQRAHADWEESYSAVLHQKWLEQAQGSEFGHPSSVFSYHLRPVSALAP